MAVLAAADEADGHQPLLGILLRLLRVDVGAALLRARPSHEAAAAVPPAPARDRPLRLEPGREHVAADEAAALLVPVVERRRRIQLDVADIQQPGELRLQPLLMNGHEVMALPGAQPTHDD